MGKKTQFSSTTNHKIVDSSFREPYRSLDSTNMMHFRSSKGTNFGSTGSFMTYGSRYLAGKQRKGLHRISLTKIMRSLAGCI